MTIKLLVICTNFGAAEVRKDLSDTTKELNDGSIKLGKVTKPMLTNTIRSKGSKYCITYDKIDFFIIIFFFLAIFISSLPLFIYKQKYMII